MLLSNISFLYKLIHILRIENSGYGIYITDIEQLEKNVHAITLDISHEELNSILIYLEVNFNNMLSFFVGKLAVKYSAYIVDENE